MKKNNEMVLSTTDLQSVGINSSLNQNDLVEVVAHDIYDKYVEVVNSVKNNVHKLYKEYMDLYSKELEAMKLALIKAKYISASENVTLNWGKSGHYAEADCIAISAFNIEDDFKGMIVKSSTRSDTVILPLKSKITIKLTLKAEKQSNKDEIKVGQIEGWTSSTTEKGFHQTLITESARLKAFAEKVKEHNTTVKNILDFLPKNGVLSIERFTREARVKMNKKIISSISPEFKEKMKELFNITL